MKDKSQASKMSIIGRVSHTSSSRFGPVIVLV
jgi:hypothetical protein